NFLLRLRQQHRPDHLGWVNDVGESFRHRTYPAYKATREKLGEQLQQDFDRSLERIAQILEAFRVPVIGVEGYEADDVIGTLATQGAARGVQVVVVSGDKDLYQLVRPGIALLNPGRGGPAAVEEHWVDATNAHERLGVPPERVVDYLALVGDSSDNVPGVKGVGEKTARELLASTSSAGVGERAQWRVRRPRRVRPRPSPRRAGPRRSSTTRRSSPPSSPSAAGPD